MSYEMVEKQFLVKLTTKSKSNIFFLNDILCIKWFIL